MKIRKGDIRKFETGEVGIVLDITNEHFYILMINGRKVLINNNTPYTSVKLDNNIRGLLTEYYNHLTSEEELEIEIKKYRRLQRIDEYEQCRIEEKLRQLNN